MADDQRGSREADYQLARIVCALGLGFVMGILLLADAFNVEYSVQPTTLTIIGTIIVVLLGVEGVNLWRGK